MRREEGRLYEERKCKTDTAVVVRGEIMGNSLDVDGSHQNQSCLYFENKTENEIQLFSQILRCLRLADKKSLF